MSVQHAVVTLRAKLQSIGRGSFLRSVGVLVSGTAFAQALTFLALPFVTRLYTPADFSALAVFVSVLSIISVAACLRLEIAIPLPESDEDAAQLLALALLTCTVISAFAGIAAWCFPLQIAILTGQPVLRPYLWMLPLSIWMASAYSAIQYWSTRKKKFGAIAKTRINQAISGIGVQIGLGWLGFAPAGLLLGQMINSGAGLLGLLRNTVREDRASLQRISWFGMRRMFRQYERFPKYSTFEAFSNNVGVQLPVIIIATLATGPEAGYLMLATRAMAAPMSLIGSAVSQVYLSRAPEELRAGRLADFTSQIIGGLAKGGIGPLLFAGILAPSLFILIFGEKWQRAGELVAWMTPWFIVQLLASPVSMTLHVTGNQRTALGLQFVGLILRVGAVAIFGSLQPALVVEAYAISGFIFYCLYLYVVMRHSGISFSMLSRELSSSAKIVSLWIMGAVGLTFGSPWLAALGKTLMNMGGR
ncbi:oligosaccharide flippase family protein [Variovorax sp. Varisp36]|uniref:oligosaccharide flippase family protein n=1 Tax=Variovorax sp. Varisp36 TaxID=3243031 RepID=UPI0039A65287